MVNVWSEECQELRRKSIERQNLAYQKAVERCRESGTHVGKQTFLGYDMGSYEAHYVCACRWPYSRPMTSEEIAAAEKTQRRIKASQLESI